MNKVIVAVLKKLLISLFTEKVLTKVIVAVLEYLVKSTKNQLDDEIITIVKERLTDNE